MTADLPLAYRAVTFWTLSSLAAFGLTASLVSMDGPVSTFLAIPVFFGAIVAAYVAVTEVTRHV